MLKKDEELILKIIECPSVSWKIDAQKRLSMTEQEVEQIANELLKKEYITCKTIYSNQEGKTEEIAYMKYYLSYKGQQYLECC